jgi:hypothetical protein
VTNGVYAAGGRAAPGTMTNRVEVTKPITLQSVHGPQFTLIQGYQVLGTTNGDGAIRCVYLSDAAVLSGFTLTNGATWAQAAGGGVWCDSLGPVVSNCVLTGNSAQEGGGVAWGVPFNCVLYNCTVTGNSAGNNGGGVSWQVDLIEAHFDAPLMVKNCTVTGNSAGNAGGGVFSSAPHLLLVSNSIVSLNTAAASPNLLGAFLNDSCTTPLPNEGLGNIDNDPLFVDLAAGNLRLQSNSPCINAGNNACVSGTTDLDGRPRIVGGTVDIGAYEFQSPASTISYAWFQQCALPTDGSADYTDTDNDHLSNYQEWTADTNPTNAASVLCITAISHGPPAIVSFQSSSARLYTLQYCTDPSSGLWTPIPIGTDIPGTGGLLTLADPDATAAPRFYRVSVRLP